MLYFIHNKEGKERVLSLSKLKTLEYRIYRKLREKLKSVVGKGRGNRKKSPDFLMKMLRKQTAELCRECDPPMPYDFYYDICWSAFDFAEDYPNSAFRIHQRYVTFLSVAMYCLDKDIPIEPKHFTDDKFLKEVMDISWKSYKEKYAGT